MNGLTWGKTASWCLTCTALPAERRTLITATTIQAEGWRAAEAGCSACKGAAETSEGVVEVRSATQGHGDSAQGSVCSHLLIQWGVWVPSSSPATLCSANAQVSVASIHSSISIALGSHIWIRSRPRLWSDGGKARRVWRQPGQVRRRRTRRRSRHDARRWTRHGKRRRVL